jgi:hypothetical protein
VRARAHVCLCVCACVCMCRSPCNQIHVRACAHPRSHTRDVHTNKLALCAHARACAHTARARAHTHTHTHTHRMLRRTSKRCGLQVLSCTHAHTNTHTIHTHNTHTTHTHTHNSARGDVAEYPEQGYQVRAVRPHQGNGVHPPRSGCIL